MSNEIQKSLKATFGIQQMFPKQMLFILLIHLFSLYNYKKSIYKFTGILINNNMKINSNLFAMQKSYSFAKSSK